VKAALYIRVSTEEQVEGFSLQAQRDALAEYCKKNNIEVFDIYADEGVSGQKENRPQFQRMLVDAENKMFNIILVHKYDRFARKVELSQRIKNQLKKSSINVISITEPIEDSPMGFFVSGLHELLAEYYVRNLSQEVQKGMRKRVSQGLHNGSVPYGYRIDKITGNIIVNDEQTLIVRKIFEMYNDGYGSVQIANWLNDNGISPAIPGAHWNHYAILYILKNVKYIGYIKHAGEIYQGIHVPIVSRETFDLAQRYLFDRYIPREPKGKNTTKYMLLGLLRCGVCGKRMIIDVSQRYSKDRSKKSYYYYYICTGNKHRETINRCTHSKRYPVEMFENETIEHLKDLLEAQMPLEASNRVDPDLIKSTQIRKYEDELLRAEAAYLAGVDDLITYAKNKKNIENKILATKSTPEIKTDIKEQLANALEEINCEVDPCKKRLILGRHINSIFIYPGGKLSVNLIV
jgi:site-specific DNA recombinase